MRFFLFKKKSNGFFIYTWYINKIFFSHLWTNVLQDSFKHHRAVWVSREPHPSIPANTQLNIWLPWLKAVTAAAQGLLRHEQKQCAIPGSHLWKKDVFSPGPLSPSYYPPQARGKSYWEPGLPALIIRGGRGECLFYCSSREVLIPNIHWLTQTQLNQEAIYIPDVTHSCLHPKF